MSILSTSFKFGRPISISSRGSWSHLFLPTKRTYNIWFTWH